MSSNLRLKIVVHGFDSPEKGRMLLGALERLVDQHGLASDVFADLMGDDPRNLRVEAATRRPVVIAGAHVWRPKFEAEIAAAMKDACPTAITEFEFDWS